MNPENLALALPAWRTCLGQDRVLDAAGAARRYALDTSGHGHSVPAALLITERSQVGAVLEVARQHRIPVYPISAGNNWGYGGASPVVSGCVVLDLSGLNRIVEMDPELGLVTLEPGVTQIQLRDYLDQYAPDFMVPTTGAGPNGSLVGNALERGYGITPYADHFGAVTALEAVLPDGRLYRSAFADLGAQAADRAFKWGLGPYLDGLFTQGSFGVVTQMTIALARRPERVESFFFGIPDEAKLGAAVLAVQQILREAGGAVGSINLMNARRMLSMTVPRPSEYMHNDTVLPEETVRVMARRHQVRPWTGVGCLYGDRRMVAAARHIVRRLLRPVADRIMFITPERSAFIGRVVRSLPPISRIAALFGVTNLGEMLRSLDQSLDLMGGRPSEVALRLTYWRSGKPPPEGAMDPARDGSGLIWYSPIIPMKPASAVQYAAMVEEVCLAHQIEPLITLTSFSDRCFDSTVPLLFDRDNEVQARRANACFEALFSAGQKLGFVPYRLGVQSMGRVAGVASPFWDLVGTIKTALDPHHIIAPGRYSPPPASDGSAAGGS